MHKLELQLICDPWVMVFLHMSNSRNSIKFGWQFKLLMQMYPVLYCSQFVSPLEFYGEAEQW
jgi:hypothetical protein